MGCAQQRNEAEKIELSRGDKKRAQVGFWRLLDKQYGQIHGRGTIFRYTPK